MAAISVTRYNKKYNPRRPSGLLEPSVGRGAADRVDFEVSVDWRPGQRRRYQPLAIHAFDLDPMSLDRAIAISEKGMTFDIVRTARLIPTLEVLNSFFRCGYDDAASEVVLHWEPFELTDEQWSVFLEYCKSAICGLQVDGLGFTDYRDWFGSVAVRNTDK